MAHTYGGVLVARASSAASPITAAITVATVDTVVVLLLKTVGSSDRTGGAPDINSLTLTQASTTQKAAASPEAGCELWYLLNQSERLPKLNGAYTLTIPNTGTATVFYTVVSGRAPAGGWSTFRAANSGNATAANPTPGAVTCYTGDIAFAITAGGWQSWAPSAQAGTVITNADDGANGEGSQYSIRGSDGSFDLNWTQSSEDWGAVVAAFGETPPVGLNNYLAVRVGSGMSTGDRVR
jgi:hypothetical protein